MPRTAFPTAWVIVCLGVCLGTARPAAAADCTNQSLQGAYGFSLNGTNFNFGVPWAIVGRFDSDGNGAITGTGTQSTKGDVSRSKFTGTYQVEADCSGVATFTFGAGARAVLQFVVVDSGKRVEMIVTDQGTLETGYATKITTTRPAAPPRATNTR